MTATFSGVAHIHHPRSKHFHLPSVGNDSRDDIHETADWAIAKATLCDARWERAFTVYTGRREKGTGGSGVMLFDGYWDL